jgi:NADH-quinone oxidoreductase subunit E
MSECTCAHDESTGHVRPAIDLELLEPILAKHAEDTGALIPVLQETQNAFGYLPKKALRAIAASRGIPFSHVYGVATFYAQFHLRPRGDKVIRICHGTACHVRGAAEVTRAVADELGVKVGETTDDRAFTLESVACVGCCGLAPVMVVGDTTYGQLQAADARRIAAELKGEAAIARGETPEPAEEAD